MKIDHDVPMPIKRSYFMVLVEEMKVGDSILIECETYRTMAYDWKRHAEREYPDRQFTIKRESHIPRIWRIK